MTKHGSDSGKGSWAKGTKITRPPERNPNVHKEIPGFPVGSTFANRIECSEAGVHAPIRAGIHGTQTDGAFSVVLSGGYEDDEDNGETITYTGQGGRDTKGTKMDQMEGRTLWEGPQNADQEWTRGNKALKISSSTKNPIRVIRGHSSDSRYAPMEGYRYDGLYEVKDAWRAEGKSGFKTCRFTFQRLPGQPTIPGTAPKTHAKKKESPSKPSVINNVLSSGPSKPSTAKRPSSDIGNARAKRSKLDGPSSPSSLVKRSNLPNSGTSLSFTHEIKAGLPKPEKHHHINAAASGSLQPSRTQELIRRPLNKDLLPMMKAEPAYPSLTSHPTLTASVRTLKRHRDDSDEKTRGDSSNTHSDNAIQNSRMELVGQATSAAARVSHGGYHKWATTAGKKKYEGFHFKKTEEQ